MLWSRPRKAYGQNCNGFVNDLTGTLFHVKDINPIPGFGKILIINQMTFTAFPTALYTIQRPLMTLKKFPSLVRICWHQSHSRLTSMRPTRTRKPNTTKVRLNRVNITLSRSGLRFSSTPSRRRSGNVRHARIRPRLLFLKPKYTRDNIVLCSAMYLSRHFLVQNEVTQKFYAVIEPLGPLRPLTAKVAKLKL